MSSKTALRIALSVLKVHPELRSSWLVAAPSQVLSSGVTGWLK